VTSVIAETGAYCARMRGYLAEMFPLVPHVAVSVAAGAGIAGFVARLAGANPVHHVLATVGPAWNIFSMLLILRMMDELKDRDIDRQLFPQRPLPAGRIHETDIRGSLVVLIALYVIGNSHALAVLISALLVLAYSGLMYRRFFAAERLMRSLPLTLATHTPIVPLLLLQAFVAAADRLAVPISELPWALILAYVAMVWLAILGWELARKIRTPEEETDYVTYSQILGRTGAIAVLAAVQALALALGLALYAWLDLHALYPTVIGAAWFVCALVYWRFLRRLDRTSSRLKPAAAMFVFALLLAQVFAFALPR